MRKYVRTFASSCQRRSYKSLFQSEGATRLDTFARRHLGPNPEEVQEMLETVECKDLDSFVEKVIPPQVLVKRALSVTPENGFTESEMLSHLKKIADKNNVDAKSLIGRGYYGTILPTVIQRNLLENPGWYTSYTPYQPEVSQGRLESLLNYQTMICDLTGLPVANASLLDEGTAAAEAMTMSYMKKKKPIYVIDSSVYHHTSQVLEGRAKSLGVQVVYQDLLSESGFNYLSENADKVSGCLVQYPSSDGSVYQIDQLRAIADVVHATGGLMTCASDLLALVVLPPPSEFGADIALGSSQRFGVPMGYGGPHGAFFSVTRALQRKMPGRLVGVSKDRTGKPALRLALQTREQHIKREKATSNICTAQALLANIAACYAVYHGPDGLLRIAEKVHYVTSVVAESVKKSSYRLVNETWFDTLTVEVGSADEFVQKALNKGFNVWKASNSTVAISLDETITDFDLKQIVGMFLETPSILGSHAKVPKGGVRSSFRCDAILTHPTFHKYHSETAMLRYLHHLQRKDVSLVNSMIPLGSCTMKLNATTEMMPLSYEGFSNLHPFAPKDQAQGYAELISELEKDLADITGLDATTVMPNSGAQGEYTGLSVIKHYFESRGESQRNIVLIPVSAHGTNPASAALAGLKVVSVKCLANGSLDLEDLKMKASKHSESLAAAMITYPSTYGLFGPGIRTAIDIVHENGGQVYMDGANMNAQVGLTSPGDLGADVCHLNLHKTFAIPHGGGGPGVGPICVKSHLAEYLPEHSLLHSEKSCINAVSSAPFGSASILPISYAYIKMMGSKALPVASAIAMLNANYMMFRLQDHYTIMFKQADSVNYCGHEFIIDLRPFKKIGIEAIDVAKRLQDYGFHAPTMSFPVPGTLMVEPTESENLDELKRFVDSMISIRDEITQVETGETSSLLLKNAPHDLRDVVMTSEEEWAKRDYSREKAGFPLPFLQENKCWPTVSRLDDTYGDMNLMCTCPSVEEVENGSRPQSRP